MSKNEKSFGFLDLIRTVFILYLLGVAIKMVYFDAPRASFDYFFSGRMTKQREYPGDTFDVFFQALLFFVILLCLFFIFSLAGIAEFAVTALIISWIVVFAIRFIRFGT